MRGANAGGCQQWPLTKWATKQMRLRRRQNLSPYPAVRVARRDSRVVRSRIHHLSPQLTTIHHSFTTRLFGLELWRKMLIFNILHSYTSVSFTAIHHNPPLKIISFSTTTPVHAVRAFRPNAPFQQILFLRFSGALTHGLPRSKAFPAMPRRHPAPNEKTGLSPKRPRRRRCRRSGVAKKLYTDFAALRYSAPNHVLRSKRNRTN